MVMFYDEWRDGKFTLASTETGTCTDTETHKMVQNPMGICISVCSCTVSTPPHNHLRVIFYRSLYLRLFIRQSMLPFCRRHFDQFNVMRKQHHGTTLYPLLNWTKMMIINPMCKQSFSLGLG